MIYYVEDDKNIRELTIYTLTQAGFEARGFPSAESFFEACKEELPQLVLLDIMLPGKDGIQILQEIRSSESTAHLLVMMLTAKGSEIDKVVGLDTGADDYLAKPFGMMELVSRVKALLRRAEPTTKPSKSIEISYGGIVLNSAAHKVTIDGKPVALTLKEFELLQELMTNRGRVLSRNQLLESVWGWEFAGNTRTVDVHIQTLRQKLAEAAGADDDSKTLIETVRGVGYMIGA